MLIAHQKDRCRSMQIYRPYALAWLNRRKESWTRVAVELYALNVDIAVVRWAPELQQNVLPRANETLATLTEESARFSLHCRMEFNRNFVLVARNEKAGMRYDTAL